MLQLWSGQISPEIKEKRSKKLLELSDKIGEEINNTYIGKTLDVLVEEKQGEFFKGHTKNYLLVAFKSDYENLKNKIVKIEIDKIKENMLIGSI